MESRKIVYKETAVIAVGELVCSAVMVGVFAALGHFSMAVLWGALTGCFVMTANYFIMAVTVSLAADRAKRGEAKKAQSAIQLSGVLRLVVMGGAMVLGIKLGANVIALLLPLLFARPVLFVTQFFRKKGD